MEQVNSKTKLKMKMKMKINKRKTKMKINEKKVSVFVASSQQFPIRCTCPTKMSRKYLH